jgi:hypothetical protein
MSDKLRKQHLHFSFFYIEPPFVGSFKTKKYGLSKRKRRKECTPDKRS